MYSLDQVRNGLEIMQYADYRTSITSNMVALVCQRTSRAHYCPTGWTINLMDLTSGEAITRLITSEWTTLELKLEEIGGYCSLAILIYLSIQLIISIFRYLRNLFRLGKTHGFNVAVVRLASDANMVRHLYTRAYGEKTKVRDPIFRKGNMEDGRYTDDKVELGNQQEMYDVGPGDNN